MPNDCFEPWQDPETNRWYWSSLADGRRYIAAPCSKTCCHRTKDGAGEHHYEEQLQHLVEVELPRAHGCEHPECKRETKVALGGEFMALVALCEIHRHLGVYRLLRPFRGSRRLFPAT